MHVSDPRLAANLIRAKRKPLGEKVEGAKFENRREHTQIRFLVGDRRPWSRSEDQGDPACEQQGKNREALN